MSETTYGRGRRIESLTVKSATVSGDHLALDFGGQGYGGCPAEFEPRLRPGTAVEMETVNFSIVTGLRVDGEWLYRKSDQDLDREHAEMVDAFRRKREESLAANRPDWQRREEALPAWIRERVESFHRSGGTRFELEGWGYELVVAELAALYAASGGEDSDGINDYARREGLLHG